MDIEPREIRCMDVMEFIKACIEAGITVDAIITDPPYAIAKAVTIVRKEWADIRLDFGSWDKFDDLESFLTWTFAWIKSCDKLLRPGGIFICFFDRDKINYISRFAANQLHYKRKNYFAWVKGNPAPQYRKVKLMTGWEVAIIMQKPSGYNAKKDKWEYKDLTFNSHLGQQPDWFEQKMDDDPRDDITIPAMEAWRTAFNSMDEDPGDEPLWFKNSITQGNERKEAMIIKKKQVHVKNGNQKTLTGKQATKTEIEKIRHPTQKPINVMKLLVDYFTSPGDLVIDPFCGVGSTLVACELEERRWIGNDNDEVWNAIANRRLKKYIKNSDSTVGLDAFMEG